MATLLELFNKKLTENGDETFSTTTDKYLDIFFMTEYYQKHLDKVNIGNGYFDQIFSMFIRDPRYGLGRRDLGRELMFQSQCNFEDVVKAGRFDDLLYKLEKEPSTYFNDIALFLYEEIVKGNELAKKWMPRYSSKNVNLARRFAKAFGMNKQEYGHFIKCDTVENKLSRKKTDEIDFEHIPSLSLLKYARRFSTGKDTCERFSKFLADVKEGKKKMNMSTTTVYDIYKNRKNIDSDLFFSKLEKIQGSWIPIVDTSGSMWDTNDSIGKAMSIGHYLSKCSTCYPNSVLSFSSKPMLIDIKNDRTNSMGFDGYNPFESDSPSEYEKEIARMYTGDCTNTNFGAVMELLRGLDTNIPEYLIVLSDMEFDQGSTMNKNATMRMFEKNGFKTKIIWWNLNSRNTTVPETDDYGNIYMSGYNPMLLKYLKNGFDGQKFLFELLEEYKSKVFDTENE